MSDDENQAAIRVFVKMRSKFMWRRVSKGRGCAAALSALFAVAAMPSSVQAQGLFDFLWGGSQEYGGGYKTVSFSPKYSAGQIIVSFGDRRLYHIRRRGSADSYPIAVPRAQSRWSGVTRVSMKKVNPSWTPTPAMLRENPKLPRYVPGGHPMNPLGNRALYLGSSLYRIHGTDAPWTIGQAVSKGCIRMYNKDVARLYPRVGVGTKVTVTWKRYRTSAGTYASYEPAKPRRVNRTSAPARVKKRRATRLSRGSLSAPYRVSRGERQ